ncbi:erythromycin esterase family protein [Caldimonas tepidiphila]|uniref:erythromycin esterase family protein n=1 Tax=Caldimonas tepidiphila TaxID=2315841 RepID=UPI000E5B83DB|nr:erythromycin esterase family protein [Caldimonas tepidiphila]
MSSQPPDLVRAIRQQAHPLQGLRDVAPIIERIGDARLVLLGEATHGTHEFYRLRAEITKRLILDKGFDAVAVEADWPDALRVSRYVQGLSDLDSADEALGGFMRFPRWMWRNEETRDLVEWLRGHNDSVREPLGRVGFFGLDLYSLHNSMHSVIRYLEKVDTEAARRARSRYACFDGLSLEPQEYGFSTSAGLTEDCEREAEQQLREMSEDLARRLPADAPGGADELFYAQQNAKVVCNAERYYRTMFDGRTHSWNLRDTHMADTLAALEEHIARQRGRPARIVVWAHNSHIGDARATQAAQRGQLNLGQLVRQRACAPGETFLLGFTTHTGTVAAASDWGEPAELKPVRPSRDDSIEGLLHDSELDAFFLPLQGELARPLAASRLERAIGVIYRPDNELMSHYFRASLSEQFDAVVHLDETRAVTPLDPSSLWQPRTEPETYPTGI